MGGIFNKYTTDPAKVLHWKKSKIPFRQSMIILYSNTESMPWTALVHLPCQHAAYLSSDLE